MDPRQHDPHRSMTDARRTREDAARRSPRLPGSGRRSRNPSSRSGSRRRSPRSATGQPDHRSRRRRCARASILGTRKCRRPASAKRARVVSVIDVDDRKGVNEISTPGPSLVVRSHEATPCARVDSMTNGEAEDTPRLIDQPAPEPIEKVWPVRENALARVEPALRGHRGDGCGHVIRPGKSESARAACRGAHGSRLPLR